MHLLTKAAAVGAAAGLGVLGWSLVEAECYVLRRHTVPVLPPGSPAIRVLHVSDLHLVPTKRRRIEWVRSLIDEQPDVVVNTGDNLAHPDSLASVMEAMQPFLSLPGMFVMGSNDYWAPIPRNPLRYLLGPSSDRANHVESDRVRLPGLELGAAFREAGWLDLDNKRGTLEVNGVTLDLVGLADAHMDQDRMPEPAPLEGAVRIGVTHAPYLRALEALRADGAEMVIAGHTHGGQVCLPAFGAIITNCDLDRRRASGLHGWPGAEPSVDPDSIWLHVSAGLGTSPYTPVRVACRPEATILDLVPRSEEALDAARFAATGALTGEV